MEAICGIFFIFMGALMFVKPKTIWWFAESWKVKTKAEPSNIYMAFTRTGGAIVLVGGIAVIIDVVLK